MLTDIAFGLFLFCAAVNVGYILYFFRRIFKLSPRNVPAEARLAVSIVVCAKNEAQNLSANLPAILTQDYSAIDGSPMFEVVVVNDCSTDDTAQVLSALQSTYPHLSVVTLAEYDVRTAPGKKFAMSKGIDAARYTGLVFTDADCRPASADWLRAMAAPLAEGKEIVAGFSDFYVRPGALNAFVRFETRHTFLQWATYALAGRPYMAVGRNMACTKASYIRAQSQLRWAKVPTGDDDFLVAGAATATNMGIAIGSEVVTWSEAMPDFKSYFAQKSRHLSAGKYYRPHIKVLLGVYAGSQAAVWLYGFALLFTHFWWAAILVSAVRMLLLMRAMQGAARAAGGRQKMMQLPMLDLAWTLYNFVCSPYVFWKNRQTWT